MKIDEKKESDFSVWWKFSIPNGGKAIWKLAMGRVIELLWQSSSYLQNSECRAHWMGAAVEAETCSRPRALIVFAGDCWPAAAPEHSPRWWWSRRCRRSQLTVSAMVHQCRGARQHLVCFRPFLLCGNFNKYWFFSLFEVSREATCTRRLIITIEHGVKIRRSCRQNDFMGIDDFTADWEFNVA